MTDLVAGYPTWSRESGSIYFENSSSEAWYRVSLSDGKVQIAASLHGLVTTVNSKGWLGMTPDGHIISARAVNTSNTYALDWEQE